MKEVIPVTAGFVLAWLRVSSMPLRLLVVALTSVAFGIGWSAFTGELARHWGYAVFDAAQVVIGYGMVRWLAARYSIPELRELVALAGVRVAVGGRRGGSS